MYGNKVSVIVVPHNPKLLAKLETLNLGYNDLAYIPDDLDRLKSLRTFKVMNNFLEKIPMRVCDMELKTIDVSSNPVIQPPIETCERGICSMKRYYHCLRMEEQSKQKALEALQSKATRPTKKQSKGKKMFNLAKPNRIMQISLGRKMSDDSTSGASVDIPSEISASTPSSPQASSKASEKSAPPAKPRSVSLNLPPLSAPNSRSGAFALESNEEVQRSKSLDGSRPIPRLSGDTFTPSRMPSTPELEAVTPSAEDLKDLSNNLDDVTVNDTLKVIFVGMAMAGKTSMIKRLIEGETAVVPKRDERTVGVDIYEWDPKDDRRFEHIDSRIELGDKELVELCGDVNVKFSVWDFAGQHVYHATHELFFSPRALYVLVWDMGATNPATKARKSDMEAQKGPFSLNYDSDDGSDDDDDFTMEEEINRADRALKRDIDDKIQFWVDCIQSSAPGAAILPVASFDDLFVSNPQEAKRRCNILKQRLLEHESRRIAGIKERLSAYVEQNRANDEGALRLRKLLGTYTRPKLIFGDTEDDAVIRVSGTKYTGFADLTERIINIATGRERAQMQYPIFRGHVGARIPRMRLEVREAVRRMRDRFKVVEWGYFTKQLQESGLTNVEDIGDALHFLTNIGELSYFGGLSPGQEGTIADVNDEWAKDSKRASMALMGVGDDVSALSEDDDLDIDDETADDTAILSIENTGITMPTTETGSISTLGDTLSSGLSQFVFLNPRWLVAAVACILRHDLDREIQETRRALAHGHKYIKRGDSFYEANLNCPVITADDACMLWQAKKFTKKAAERVEEYSNDMPVKPFEFLQLLLIRFGVFVPIDLSIEKAFLGGQEYARRLSNDDDKPAEEITIGQSNSVLKATFFFLPSLLGPGEPTEAWTYKSTDSWKATLCHSVLFPNGVPPGLMERITASVLSNIYAIAHRQEQQTYRGIDGTNLAAYEGQLTVKEVLCWRTAFLVKVAMQMGPENKESIVEVFCGLVDKESHLCVGSDAMLSGMRRLVTSGKGQEGDGGRKIWKGGYLIVLKAVQKVMDEYGGLEYEKQGFCPDCLAKKAVAEASFWDFTVIRGAIKNGESIMHCRYGHRIDTRLVAGPLDNLHKPARDIGPGSQEPVVPIHDVLRGVVVVGLWDGHSKSRKVIRVGSGFIADRKRGLIVTAAHTLMNIWGDKSTPFGENYYGLRNGKIVIGIIPKKKGDDTGTEAVFRYFAKIVAKDPFIEQGVCHLDACVLKITTRMENDVLGNGEGCGDEPERLLLNNPIALKQEKLHHLKITDKCELDEQVRIVGYNQGGEGLLGPGFSLNRYVDFARGYVCKKFAAGEGASDEQLRHRFKPREEIVVICPTIGGHSGGPCVNQQGEVLGILSRADPAESQRCYLVPTYEWRALLRQAKNAF
jgi:GTPase SAR1 family protein